MKYRSYAKALYYKEQQFLFELVERSSPCPGTLSGLLTIYSKLQLEEAVNGVLVYAARNPHDKLVSRCSRYASVFSCFPLAQTPLC